MSLTEPRTHTQQGRRPCRRVSRHGQEMADAFACREVGRFVRTGHRITGDRTGQWSLSLPNQGWEYLHVCINDASRIACTGLGGWFPTPLYL